MVFAWCEPPLFVADARGGEPLAAAGAAVTELPQLAARAGAANSHLPLAE